MKYGRGFGLRLKNLYRTAMASDFIPKIAETFATRIFLLFIGMITTIIVARILGPGGRGLYAVAGAVGAIGIQFGNLGLQASNTYFVSRERDLLPKLVGNSLLVSFGLGTLGAVLAWLFFLLWPQLAPVKGWLLVLALSWIPVGLGYMLLQNLLVGIQDIRNYNKVELMTRIVTVGLIGLVIIAGKVTVEAVFAAGWVALAAGFGLVFWKLRICFRKVPAPSVKLLKENFKYGLKAYLAFFASFLIIRVDLLMVKYWLGSEQAGYYSVAASLADLLYMLPAVIGTILFPKLAAMNNDADRWALTRKWTIRVGLLTAPMVMIAVFLAGPVITLLFGKDFLPTVQPFIILALAMFTYGMNNILSNYLSASGFPLFSVWVWVIGLALNLGLNLYAIPEYGISGAAWTSLISYGMVFGLQLMYATRKVNRDESQTQLRSNL